MLERPRVQTLWVESVTRALRQLINVLEDDVPAFSTESGVVTLDLQPLMIQLGERIAVFGAVAERFGPDAGRIEIAEADRLETAQDLTQLQDSSAPGSGSCRSSPRRSRSGSHAVGGSRSSA